MDSPPDLLENSTFDEIRVGDSANLQRTLSLRDIQLFAVMSGDVNPAHPAHIDPDYARNSVLHEVVAHGLWGGSLISTVLGTVYPGPGTVYVDQTLHFVRPVTLGDTLTASVTVREKFQRTRHVLLDCKCTNQHGHTVIEGVAEVLAPAGKVRRPRVVLPEVRLHDPATRYAGLLETARHRPPIRVGVVHPCDRASLDGALGAAQAGLIVPILIGPRARIESLARESGMSLDGVELVDAPHSHAAAASGVAQAREGRVDALMKGSLHTDELMSEVVAQGSALRTARRLSHVFHLNVPTYSKPLLLTDAALNIAPDLEAKRDVVQNAIDLAIALGIAQPKVAILAAVETVNPRMRSTLDAAALCKMADRGQILNGILDGPLAFDNAISLAAARSKGIVSAVAGEADILVVPDIESGNMIAKQFEYLADAAIAGIVVGGRIPIILTSRADGVAARVASCALALLAAGGRGS